MTANAVCSLPLEPVLPLVRLDDGARTPRVVRDTRRCGVDVLEEGPEALARRAP